MTEQFPPGQGPGDAARAIDRLVSDLGMPARAAWMQDWPLEAWHEDWVSEEWLARYLAAYARADYGPAEQIELMRIMLLVVDDLLDDEDQAGVRAWERVAPLVRMREHDDLIQYWCCDENDDVAEAFTLTPLMRDLRARLT